uniref:Uncharacterized protein n=1 Tax=Meloidogyne enterolobii TaxID=390850 RepID=A0A6V7W0D5_MELEN|nr:unnamed protein product [Meloidogyne enterolobii]
MVNPSNKKIAGALESHNVQSRKTSDIRSLFGNNKQSDNSKKNQNDFSLLLIDECDIIYSSDSNFWSTLRQICTESKIPIILTCNDLEYVLKEIGKDFDGNKDDFFVIQMERPSDRLFAQYLRHWYFGFTSHYHKTCSFYNLITIKNKDPRAVLNSLHFWDLDISDNDSFSNRRSSSIEREENLSLSECQKRSKILSKLDASFGPGEKKNISILTKCSINLDFNNEEEGFLNNWGTKIEELNELRLEYLASVDMDDSDLLLQSIEYKEIIKMFCLRSSNKFYSLRETCLYHLPCLLSIHQSWCSKIHLLKQQYRQQDGSNLFPIYQSPRRFPPHPFDIVDTITGTMLNQNKSLSSIPPVLSEYLEFVHLYLLWLQHVKWLYMLGQIVKLSSVFCLIVASFERYLVTSHWTFGGFEERTRWLLLVLVLTLAIAIRFSTSVEVVVLIDGRNIDPFKRYTAGQVSRRDWLPNFLSLLTVIIPFATLVFLNGGIVLMLRQQNVQQLRSLITELTMGHDFMKVRRRNIRAATNTLLFIISAYLISNLLNLFLSILVFLQPGLLQRTYPHQYRLISDFASVLTVIGNALRFPAHFFSNGEVREQLLSIFYTSEKISSSNASILPTKQPLSTVLQLRRHSERLENPWFSALLTARPSQTSQDIFKKLSSNSNSSTKSSRKSTQQQQQHKLSNTSSNFNFNKNGKGAAQLRSYIHGALEASQKVEGIKRLPTPQFGGICAICNEYFINGGDCCNGSNLETEREPLFEELFNYKQKINETRPLVKEKDGKKEEEEEEESDEEEEEDSTKSTTQPRPTPEEEEEEDAEEDEDVDFSKLKFDPADFASLAMAI